MSQRVYAYCLAKPQKGGAVGKPSMKVRTLEVGGWKLEVGFPNV